MKSKSSIAQGAAEGMPLHQPAAHVGADYIEVAGFDSFDLEADFVTLSVRVDGDVLDASRNAMSTVPELGALATSMKEAGADSPRIIEVEAREKSGLLSAGLQGRYIIEVGVPLDALPTCLSIVDRAKESELISTTWRYPDASDRRRESLMNAAASAQKDANALASALELVELGSPLCVLPSHSSTDISRRAPVVSYSSKMGSPDVHLSLTARRTVHTKVIIRFRPA